MTDIDHSLLTNIAETTPAIISLLKRTMKSETLVEHKYRK